MALPKIMAPEFTTVVPSTKQEVTFRPFLVKEEKILFMAAQSESSRDIAAAIKKMLENCISTDIDIESLAGFDIEYLFLQLRSKSVGEVIELQMAHVTPEYKEACNHVHAIEVDISAVQIVEDESHSCNLQMTDSIGVVMRYPGISDMLAAEDILTADNKMDMFKFAARGIVQVFDSEEVYDEFTDEELMDFVESLSNDQFQKIVDFYDTMPKLRHSIEWTCPECSKTEISVVEGLQGFFI
jgi:hypothetical protein